MTGRYRSFSAQSSVGSNEDDEPMPEDMENVMTVRKRIEDEDEDEGENASPSQPPHSHTRPKTARATCWSTYRYSCIQGLQILGVIAAIVLTVALGIALTRDNKDDAASDGVVALSNSEEQRDRAASVPTQAPVVLLGEENIFDDTLIPTLAPSTSAPTTTAPTTTAPTITAAQNTTSPTTSPSLPAPSSRPSPTPVQTTSFPSQSPIQITEDTITSNTQQLAILASRDATLLGGLSSAASSSCLFVGNTRLFGPRRSLLQFDIHRLIDASKTKIVQAELRLGSSSVQGRTCATTLNRVTANWGEAGVCGGTNSAGERDSHGTGLNVGGGNGETARPGAATWDYRFAPNDQARWTTPGGDFVETVSATQELREGPSVAVYQSPQLLKDVQDMLANPATNFGWILRGDACALSMRLVPREADAAMDRPTLVVDFVGQALDTTAPTPTPPSAFMEQPPEEGLSDSESCPVCQFLGAVFS